MVKVFDKDDKPVNLVTDEIQKYFYANALSFSNNKTVTLPMVSRGVCVIGLTLNGNIGTVFDILFIDNGRITNRKVLADSGKISYSFNENKELVVTCETNWSYGICIMNK